MKNKFLQISFGISLVLFSLAFFIRTISTAQAAPAPEKFISEGTSSIGKYTLTFLAYDYVANNGTESAARRVIIMDTETGKTIYYGLDDGDSGWKKMDDQIPANPFGE
jgi:hypothetical protein